MQLIMLFVLFAVIVRGQLILPPRAPQVFCRVRLFLFRLSFTGRGALTLSFQCNDINIEVINDKLRAPSEFQGTCANCTAIAGACGSRQIFGGHTFSRSRSRLRLVRDRRR